MKSNRSDIGAPAALPAEFAHALQYAGDRVRPLAARCLWYPVVTSTNDVAVRLAESGAGEGVAVVADMQTAGRGRLGRVWVSPAGAGVYASVILRPAAHVAPLVTLAAGVAIADAIQAATGLSPSVKWPNDIVIDAGAGAAGHRKLGGILAEGGTSSGPPEGGPYTGEGGGWVVLGFGINVLPAAYPTAIASRATSLETELGRPVERGLVLAECLAALSRRYSDLREGKGAALVEAWRRRAASTFGRRVEWDANGIPHEGIAQDVDATGALLVGTAAGVSRIVAGEVRWI